MSHSGQPGASGRSPRGRLLALAIVGLSLIVPPAAAGEPVERGQAERSGAWIGVWLGDALDGGVEIVALVPGGPAQQAGLNPGDIIIEANQATVTNRGLLQQALTPLTPGDSLELVLLRSGDLVRRTLTVDRRVAVPPTPTNRRRPPALNVASIALMRAELLGLQVTEITPELRRHYGAPEDAGVLVVGKAGEGLLGIRVGDVLLRVGDRKIAGAGQLAWFSRWTPGAPLQVEVVRDRQRTMLTVEETKAPQGSDPGILGLTGRSTEERERELLRARLEREIERLEERLEQLRKELNRQGASRDR